MTEISKKKRILKELNITKIAAVDYPCQEHALAAIIKSKTIPGSPGKPAGSPSEPTDKGTQMSAINKALGLKDDATEAEALAAIAKANAELEAAKAAKTKAETDAAAMKADCDAKTEAAETVKKNAEAEIAKAAGDETFTKFDGAIIKKSAVGPEMFSMLKAANDEVVKARLAAETSELAKRAEGELKHVGKVDDTVVLLRMAKRASEEDGKILEALLKSHSDMVAKGFNKFGHKDSKVDPEDPESKLDMLVKARMKADNLNEDLAMAKVLETADGASLYAQIESQ